MVQVAVAIEDNLRDALVLQPLCDGLTDELRAGLVVAARLSAQSRLQRRLGRRRRCQRLAAHVVNDLHIDMRLAAIDGQPRTLLAAGDPLAEPQLDSRAAIFSSFDSHNLLLLMSWGPTPTTCAFAAFGGLASLEALICLVRRSA